VYSFPQVHQLISTVTGEMKPGIANQQILEYAFPMGSMTGAPKMMVMQLIEEYEQSRRGLYSGAIGYITPQGDFDFNVVIRSLLYNARTKYLSYQTGGAITYDSDPQLEWEEVRLKAKAMEQVFL
jgi:para-aminobenzoate synthetase component 1